VANCGAALPFAPPSPIENCAVIEPKEGYQLSALSYQPENNRDIQYAAIDKTREVSTSGPALISELLAEQRSFSAVERFDAWHTNGDRCVTDAGGSQRADLGHYRELLPASPPGPGQQYAFEVDLDQCSGCKACVVACHALNGLDEHETWRDVGLLIGGSRTSPVVQHVTAACHHCLQPACMTACPVNAYEKDLITGIVKHLDDQCFGCQYCTMACPYEVPKYHSGKGIVRKCDMCSSRLAIGEPPACVQSCPHQAITIRVVDHEQVMEDAETSVFLPAAPDPLITLPTTTYRSRRPFPRNALPADYFRINRQHAHWPLVVMLVLTQLSVGAFTVGLILEQSFAGPMPQALRPLHSAAALGFGLLAITASLFHLGRPQFAFRAVLGLGHSWLSREIVAFGAFAILATLYAIAVFTASTTSEFKIRMLGWSVAMNGAIAVFCSMMIYVFTQRECWSLLRVGVRFALTSVMLGIGVVWLSVLTSTIVAPSTALLLLVHRCGPPLCWSLVAAALAKLAWEAAIFRHLWIRNMTPLKRSALLMTGELSNVAIARFALGLLGGVILPTLLAGETATLSAAADSAQFVIFTGFMFATCLAGEFLERYLFFSACAAPQMPGGIR
jgi:Fe-S-cluster-containing dehydrogenase component/DMSO reductase anchor subunit